MLIAALIAYACATIFDALTTVSVIHAGGRERNPLLRKGGFSVVAKLGIAAALAAGLVFLLDDPARWVALFTTAGLWFGLAVYNRSNLAKQRGGK